MLRIENLKVKYGDFVALDIQTPVEFHAGDRIGIIGGNGAGKTTFVKALSGLLNYEGIVDTKLTHGDIALHLQENSYVKRMPIRFIIEAVFNVKIEDNPRLSELIKFFDFEACLPKRYAALSGGQKQKLTLIMVLLQDKPLTFFDEVTSGLDFDTRQKLMQKIVQWYKGRPSTICVVSHYYDELENIVNKLLIIDKGVVVDYGSVDELFKKYCASVVIVIENNEHNAKTTADFEKIASPAHLIAFPCKNPAAEAKLTAQLLKENINYKRSNKDIEILFVNALERAKGGRA
jgi:ABC-2 type transport system ATP-binding protein